MVGLERISAIIFHISASYLVYLAVSRKKPLYYLLAILVHFLMDAAVVVIGKYLPVLLVEILLLLGSAVFGFVIWRMYRKEQVPTA